jgi:hypothetical protein
MQTSNVGLYCVVESSILTFSSNELLEGATLARIGLCVKHNLVMIPFREFSAINNQATSRLWLEKRLMSID